MIYTYLCPTLCVWVSCWLSLSLSTVLVWMFIWVYLSVRVVCNLLSLCFHVYVPVFEWVCVCLSVCVWLCVSVWECLGLIPAKLNPFEKKGFLLNYETSERGKNREHGKWIIFSLAWSFARTLRVSFRRWLRIWTLWALDTSRRWRLRRRIFFTSLRFHHVVYKRHP